MARLLAIAAIWAIASCAPGYQEGAQVLVSAAASLTDVFGAIEAAFEEANPGIDVVLDLGPSSGLREQILEGAPVDVYASADEANMDQLVDAGAVGLPQVFAYNQLQIAVPRDNPGGVTGLADFAREDLLVGLCAEVVPCGDLGRQSLAKAGVAPSIDTDEPDVRSLLTKIAAGELDAGIVYVTDVIAAEGVVGIDIPSEHNVVAVYPIAVLVDAPNPRAAETFVSFVMSEEGKSILSSFGFGAP